MVQDRSHQNSAVKRAWARVVPGRVTLREVLVLHPFFILFLDRSSTLYANCFDLIHSDVWTAPCLSRDSFKYFVTFIDEKSKYTWITLIQTKDRVLEAFKNFQNYVTNHYNAKIKILRSISVPSQ